VAFAGGNFTVDPNPSAAAPPLLVSGSFDIDLDNRTSPSEQTAGLHNTTIGAQGFPPNPGDPLPTYPFAVDSPWAFSYDKTTDILVVGGSDDGAESIHFGVPTANDFYLQIHDFSKAPFVDPVDPANNKPGALMWQLGFSQSASPGSNFFTPSGGDLANGFAQVTALGPVATTPLPAGLPLFLTALVGLGVVAMRKRSGAWAPLAR
jgi:hypothetical protein